ncbi:MAG: amidohydrolase family protein [Candidatus Hydrogenedentes bacterium]|nr:amidohydrolase family protein [Candidatus Hydrogenedentota bacterium]
MKRTLMPEIFVLLFALMVGIPNAAYGADFETPIAIVGATVVTEPGAILEDATILIENGRIRQVGTAVTVPRHARELDARGLWVYAGFIDATSHVGMSEDPPGEEEMARLTDVEQEVAEGPRTHMQHANRNEIWPHRGPADFYVADEEKLEAYRESGFTTALVSPHPAIIGGYGDVLQLSGLPLRRATLESAVTQIFAYGTPPEPGAYSKPNFYPVSRTGAVALMRQTFMDAQWYREGIALFDAHSNELQRPAHDPVLEAMGELVDRRQRILFLANTTDEIHHALDLAREFDQPIVILGGNEAWKVAGRLEGEGVPVIASVDWPKKPLLTPDNEAEAKDDENDAKNLYTTTSWTPEWEDDFFEPLSVRKDRVRRWEDRVGNVQRLLDAGVSVALTGRGLKKQDEFLEKLRTMMEYGLSSDDALALLTSSPASILGIDSQIGSIVPGKIANLTVLTGPLEDETAKTRYLFIDGAQFDFSVLHDAKEDDEDGDDTEANSDDEDAETPDPHSWIPELEADRTRPMTTDGAILLKHATVLTITDGTRIDTDVLVEHGKIRAIGSGLSAPDGATVIDLSGHWLMPGIVDPHSHMAIRGGVNEWTQSITSEVRMTDVVDPTQLAIHRALAGGVTTIHTMHGSANAIGGQNAILKLKFESAPHEALVTSGPRIVKFALGENVTRARPVPRFPNTRMGVESVMRQAFNDALDYKRVWNDYDEAQEMGRVAQLPRRDLRLDALNEILAGDIWVHSHCYRGDEILRLLNVAEDYGFRIGTLQHVLEGYRVAPEMLRHGVGGSTFSDWWSYKKEAFDAIPYNASMMMRAGIVTSLNSDSAETVRHMNLEAAKTMRFGGLTADEALRLITINPAIQIGLDARIGSIEVGKDADFAVFNGHPLDTFSRNILTIIEGEVYFRHRDFDPSAAESEATNTYIPTPPGPLLDIPTNPARRYAIVGGTVHPVSQAAFENGLVVIVDGKLERVSVAADWIDDGETTVVDATGLHVYPGLINAASQLTLVEISRLKETDDRADLATFQPELKTISALNPHSVHVGVSLCEGITTVALFPSGGVVSGRAGLVQLSGWTMPEMLRQPEVGLVVDLPSLPTEIVDKEEREEQLKEHREVFEKIEAFFEEARHYAKVAELGQGGTASDVRLASMRPYVLGEKPVFFRANTYKEILEAIRFSEVFALDPVIVGGADAWKCAEVLADKDIPVIVSSVFRQPTYYEPWDAYYANAAKLEAAGVRFCISSRKNDIGPSTFYGVEKLLPLHAGMAVAHGLSEDGALRSITLSAAEILGVDNEIGSLETGKIADVIITTGHPCRANTRTVGCFIAGEPVELTSIHEQNYEKFLERPEPNLPPIKLLRGPAPMRSIN